MKRLLFLLVAALGAAVLAPAQVRAGNILISGSEMQGHGAALQADLAFYGHTSTIVNPANLGTTSFAGFTGIWLGWNTSYGTSLSLTGNLLAFLNAGGTVFVETPFTNALSFLPGVAGLGTNGAGGEQVHITAPSNPINAGLTDAGLSNWFSSHHDEFTTLGGFSQLTNSSDGAGGSITIVQTIGAGHLVLTTQDVSFHIFFGGNGTGPTSPPGVFLGDVFALQPTAVPEPTSLAVFGLIGLCGAGAALRRRKTAKI